MQFGWPLNYVSVLVYLGHAALIHFTYRISIHSLTPVVAEAIETYTESEGVNNGRRPTTHY